MTSRKPNALRGRIVRPTIFEVNQAFDLIDQMVDQLIAGELEYASDNGVDVPVFRTKSGAEPMIPPLEGWIAVWQRFADGFGFELDQTALTTLINKLSSNEILRLSEVASVQLCVMQQRAIYRQLDVYRIRSYAVTEQIAIQLEQAA
ncbi:hypothetical protein [Deefgea piscis]|uniref:hypothetical protein n=1 Tax=Deefgea piscis TaxID=2739061 RepID=UPI001C7E6485|nr:hypothetical protein [Deefgea piscis]QZA80266.1 hypothetical protein K4H25_12060 [Deefgea piscis]